MSVAIRAASLMKTYKGRDGEVEAVRGVDLEVAAGEIFGFLGPNGAGKSTTIRMLTTLMTITSGSAEVAGVDVASEPDKVRRKLGVALQEAGLDPRHRRFHRYRAARPQGRILRNSGGPGQGRT
jgi:ABC-2 type transport system ATP-binding protein